MKSPEDCPEDLMEKLAAIEHERWADWQKYVFEKCVKNEHGNYEIPSNPAIRWQTQIDTHYWGLSEKEKESDRREVRRYWPVIAEYFIKSQPHAEQAKWQGMESAPRDSKIIWAWGEGLDEPDIAIWTGADWAATSEDGWGGGDGSLDDDFQPTHWLHFSVPQCPTAPSDSAKGGV